MRAKLIIVLLLHVCAICPMRPQLLTNKPAAHDNQSTPANRESTSGTAAAQRPTVTSDAMPIFPAHMRQAYLEAACEYAHDQQNEQSKNKIKENALVETYPALNQKIVDYFVNIYCPKELGALLSIYVEALSNPSNMMYQKAMLRKIILVGPPGVGKSMLAKALVHHVSEKLKKVGITLRSKFISAASIPNEYKNSGITRLDRLFNPSFNDRSHPAIVILDELTGLTDRQTSQNNADPGVIEHFLTILDRCNSYNRILVIMTANDIKKLSDPLKSRVHRGIFRLQYPTLEQRMEMIKLYLSDCTFDLDEFELEKVARASEKLSGREIEDMVGLAACAH